MRKHTYMQTVNIRNRMVELERYLNRNWKGLGDHFTDRLLAKSTYDSLEKQLHENRTQSS